jgi:hypothetical protein
VRSGKSFVAILSLVGFAGCAQGQTGSDPAQGADLAGNCPASGATVPAACPCTCPSGTEDTGDAGGAAPAASPTTATTNAGPPATSATSDAGVNAAALLALLGSPVRSDPNPVPCPSSFSCQSFNGLPACQAQGALAPPSCQTNADCTAAGLPGVPCVTLSFDVAGVFSVPLPFCVALCTN